MIKAKMENGDLIFGLSEANVQRMKEGQPIRIDMAELGGSGFTYIIYGQTEKDIAKELGVEMQ